MPLPSDGHAEPAEPAGPQPPRTPTYPSGGVSSSVQDAVRRDIITGGLVPGSRITETTLADRYGVSRVPVREALRGLESEGFVESRPHAGSRVADIPVDDADDLFAVRETLEVATSRRAARRAAALWSTDESPAEWWEQRRQIGALLDEGDACVARDDLEPLVELNDLFHLGIARLTGSATLLRLLRQLSWKIEWLYAAGELPRGKRLWPEHRLIIGAIDAGDSERAGSLMAAHVRESRIGYHARYDVPLDGVDPDVAAAVVQRRAELGQAGPAQTSA